MSEKSVADQIKHYQKYIERCPENAERMLRCIQRLYVLPVTVQHLQETGIGRSVNALRKCGGEVAEASKAIIAKWKAMVVAEEGSSDDQESRKENTNEIKVVKRSEEKHGKSSHSSSHHKGRVSEKRKSEVSSGRDNERKSKKAKVHESKEKENRQEKRLYVDGKHSHSARGKQKRVITTPEESSAEDSDYSVEKKRKDSEEKLRKQNVRRTLIQVDSDSDDEKQENSCNEESDIDETKDGIESEESDRDGVGVDSDDDDEEGEEEEEVDEKEGESSEESSGDSQSGSQEVEQVHRKNNSSSTNSHSNPNQESKHRGERTDNRKTSHKENLEKERRRRAEAEKRKEKEKAKKQRRTSSSSTSSKSKAVKSYPEKEIVIKKEKDDVVKVKKEKIVNGYIDDENCGGECEQDGRRKEKEMLKMANSSSHSKSKPSKHSPEKEFVIKKEKEDIVKVKKEKIVNGYNDDGSIGGESGSSFEAALMGMSDTILKSPKKKKPTSVAAQKTHSNNSSSSRAKPESGGSSKIKVSSSNCSSPMGSPCEAAPPEPGKVLVGGSGPSGDRSDGRRGGCLIPDNESSPYYEPELLSRHVKLEPLDVDINATLPEISPNYMPLPHHHFSPKESARKLKTASEEEALSSIWSNKNSQRTKVFSGNKCGYSAEVPTLFKLCIQVLQENIDCLEYTGGVPYYLMKPILEKATASQLLSLENYNPYLIDDTAPQWAFHCNKDFRGKKRQEMESWRELYLRCTDEREVKFKALTAKVSQSMEKSMPVRQTKLAYVDSLAKPPRNIARKQAKFGTANPVKQEIVSKAVIGAHSSGTVATEVVSLPPTSSRSQATISTPFIMKKKKAPLMAKALQLIKGNRYKR